MIIKFLGNLILTIIGFFTGKILNIAHNIYGIDWSLLLGFLKDLIVDGCGILHFLLGDFFRYYLDMFLTLITIRIIIAPYNFIKKYIL